MAEDKKILRYEELNDDDRRTVDEILESMLNCSSCSDVGGLPKRKWGDGLNKVDEYMKILPGADYVLTQTLNYIFSNGLTTGSINAIFAPGHKFNGVNVEQSESALTWTATAATYKGVTVNL